MPQSQNLVDALNKKITKIRENSPKLRHYMPIGTLELTDSDIRGLLAALAQNQRLTHLQFVNNGPHTISLKGMRLFIGNTTLRHFNVAKLNLNDEITAILAENSTFRDVTLDGNCVGPATTSAFAQNTTLHTLSLANNFITHKEAVVLAENTSLSSLNLSVNSIGNTGAKAFALKNKGLKSLNLSQCHIGPEGAKAFAENTTLIELNLSANPIDDNAAATLFAKAIMLKSLNLSYCRIGAEAVEALAKNITLKTVFLNALKNRITQEDAQLLVQNKDLKSLHLGQNQMSSEVASRLASMSSLQELTLEHNLVDDQAAAVFAANTTLMELNLSSNPVGHVGATLLAQNTTLRGLALDFIPGINNEVAKSFATNTTLVTLSLGGKLLGERGAALFLNNTTLLDLCLSRHTISQNVLEGLNTVLQCNRANAARFLQACARGNLELVNLLLEQKLVSPYAYYMPQITEFMNTQDADLFVPEPDFNNGLHFAVLNNQYDLAYRLAKTYPQLSRQENRAYKTPMQLACDSDNQEMIQMLQKAEREAITEKRAEISQSHLLKDIVSSGLNLWSNLSLPQLGRPAATLNINSDTDTFDADAKIESSVAELGSDPRCVIC